MSNSTIPIASPTNLTDCRFRGNSDMYGCGIRIGFYLQWYSSIIASVPTYTTRSELSMLAPGESKNLIFSNIVFIVASSLALLAEAKTLRLAEIYIISLLIFGYMYYSVLSLITRIVRRCNPNWRLSGSKQPGHVYVGLTSLLILIVSCIELWFWGLVRHAHTTSGDCKAFGFGLKKVNLKDTGFIGFNITYFTLILVWSILSFWVSWDPRLSASDQLEANSLNSSRRGSRRETPKEEGCFGFEVLRSTLKFIFMTIVIAAIELSITWNQITGVRSLSSAGQLIPFFIGFAALMRVFYVAYKGTPDD